MNGVAPRRLLAENLPYAGLGNRLRFTLSSQSVAADLGAKFEYYWPVGDEFGARFTDLWQFDAEEVDRVPATAALQSLTSEPWPPPQPEIHLRSASVIRGSGREGPWEASLPRLRPSVEVAEGLAEFRRNRLADRYVGVQIRLSPKTHAKTLEASPLEWYIDRMRAIQSSNPDAFFFISSDSEAASNVLEREFKNSAMQRKDAAYNSRPALIQSVVDLILLSEADHLLGPYWSSFVQTAWLLGGRRQVLEHSRAVQPADPAPSVQQAS